MNFAPKALILGLALLGPLAAHGETAPPVATTEEPGPAGSWGEHGKRRMQERLDQLHKDLKLTGEQEGDWKAWFDKVNEAKQERREHRPDLEALGKLSAPERLEKMIEFGKARQAALEEVLGATKTFYGKLTPEQRKTFDDRMPFGERAPHWRGRSGSRGGDSR
jgi:Spy/CpxP family protein refolding chaperone